ncbi:MAG: hypothetical protein Q8M17_13085 [Actinomycetota bacterium]|nr:hypothetical protein [Actinomycetota bacterium]
MTDTFTVLVVCRANVCRSPVAERLLARWSGQVGLDGIVRAESAGWDAEPGAARCAQGEAWLPGPLPGAAVELAGEHLDRADLVLALDREARAACVRLSTACRPRLLTVTQAGFLADRLGRMIETGEPIAGAPPVPEAPADRLRWLVAEMDAARELLAGRPEDADDIVDRHGVEPHAEVFDEVDLPLAPLTRAWAALMA